MAEKDLYEQLLRYVDIDSLSPTLGIDKGKIFQTAPASISLIADQAGVYLFSEGKLLDCDMGLPRWRREDLSRIELTAIREKIIELSNS